MKILITGSAGHLGEALVRTLRERPGFEPVGIDLVDSPFTQVTGSIADPAFVRECMHGVDGVLHAATLHKPHVASHSMQQFIDVNLTGTLVVLEAAAEDICQLVHGQHGLPCVVLRTSRFFPEDDDDDTMRDAYHGLNLKANEMLFRRADLADVVDAHVLALREAPRLGFDRFIVSATTPFVAEDAGELHVDLPAVLDRRVPGWRRIYADACWQMLPTVDRVYVNDRAREILGWRPRWDFAHVLESVAAGADFRSPLALAVGSKGYHRRPIADMQPGDESAPCA